MTKCWGAGKGPNRICMNSISMQTSLLTYIPKPMRKIGQVKTQPHKKSKEILARHMNHYLIIESEDPDKQYLQ